LIDENDVIGIETHENLPKFDFMATLTLFSDAFLAVTSLFRGNKDS
jgi:hypothetical protein